MTEQCMRMVTTQTAVYEVDLVGGRIRRCPMDQPSSEDWIVATNRRDGEWMDLVLMVQMEVGKRMYFLVRIPETPDGMLTTRVTTPVQKIEILG